MITDNFQFSIFNLRNQTGFTLIELMVVTSIAVVLSLATVSLLFSTLKGSTKDKTIQAVKLDADNAMVQIENLIRSSSELVENAEVPARICGIGMSSLGLKKPDGSVTIIEVVDSRLSTTEGFLTTSDVLVSGLQFQCHRGTTGNPAYVEVWFSLGKGVPGADKAEEVFWETFKTGVSLRQF